MNKYYRRRVLAFLLLAVFNWLVIQSSVWAMTIKPDVIDGGDLLAVIILGAYGFSLARVIRKVSKEA